MLNVWNTVCRFCVKLVFLYLFFSFKVLITLPILYMLAFPIIIPYAAVSGYGVLSPLLLGTLCTASIIVMSATTKPPVRMIKNAYGKRVERCWKCAGASIRMFPLVIMSMVSFGILYCMEFIAFITAKDVVPASILAVACSLYIYMAIIRVAYPETAKPCMHWWFGREYITGTLKK